jgi:hypothetical protein
LTLVVVVLCLVTEGKFYFGWTLRMVLDRPGFSRMVSAEVAVEDVCFFGEFLLALSCWFAGFRSVPRTQLLIALMCLYCRRLHRHDPQ